MSLRLLVISYYFPPSGGAGVQRATKWVKYLPQVGVEPIVLTVREGAYPTLDPTLVSEVEGTEVVRTAAPDPFGLYGLLTGRTRQQAVAVRTGRVGDSQAMKERFARWFRSNLFIPDARVGWVPFGLAGARQIRRMRPVDVILTTGPPHSTHLIGRRLQAAWGVPWIADFRDPWTEIHYTGELTRSNTGNWIDASLERSVLTRANLVLTVSEPLRKSLAARTDTRVAVIRNGFDPADFEGPRPDVGRDTFDIVYTGTLFGVPTGLLDAIAALRQQEHGKQIRLRFVGTVPPEFMEAVDARGLTSVTSAEAAVSHIDAIRLMRQAGLLLLTIETEWSYAPGVVPGKTYEYLASGRPVLGLGPVGDAEEILRITGAGEMVSPLNSEAIRRIVDRHYRAWDSGSPISGASEEKARPYSRIEGVLRLRDLMAEL